MRTPPFGKLLERLLLSGQKPNNSVYLYLGYHAWAKGKSSSVSRPKNTLILPIDKSVYDYDWPVMGCEILIIETSNLKTEYVENVVQHLFDYGASKALLISQNLSITSYKKDF